MQVDPAALSRPDSASAAMASSKAAASASAAQKPTKALISVPRLDLEPIYTDLKAAIGDNWAEYKQSTGLFLLGTTSLPFSSHVPVSEEAYSLSAQATSTRPNSPPASTR